MCAETNDDDPEKTLYRKARRRIATVTPENAAKVKRHERYWTRPFLELFFERCERSKFERPAETLAEAKHLADLVSLIRIGDEPGELRSESEQRSWRVRCLALEAEIAGLAGCRSYMRAALDRAAATADGSRVQVIAGAELLKRQAVIAMREDKLDEAATRIDASEGLYRRIDPGIGLGEALVIYALVKDPLGDGIVAAAEALCRISPRDDAFSGRLWDAALSMWLAHPANPRAGMEHYEALLGWLYLARRQWFSRRSKCRRKLGLIWGEGMALARLGLGRLAQRRLSTAWHGFSRLGLYEQMTLAALDLAHALIGDDERALAVEMLRAGRDCVRRLNGDPELKALLEKAESASLVELTDLRQESGARHLPRVGDFFPLRHPEAPPEGVGAPENPG